MFRMIDVSHTTCNVMSRDVSCTIIDENKMLLTASHEMKVLLYSLLALLRFLPAQQLLERHLAEGRSGRGPADRGGHQDQAEAAAEPVLPEHRPAQGEQAPSGPGVKKTSRHSPAQPEVSSSSKQVRSCLVCCAGHPPSLILDMRTRTPTATTPPSSTLERSRTTARWWPKLCSVSRSGVLLSERISFHFIYRHRTTGNWPSGRATSCTSRSRWTATGTRERGMRSGESSPSATWRSCRPTLT